MFLGVSRPMILNDSGGTTICRKLVRYHGVCEWDTLLFFSWNSYYLMLHILEALLKDTNRANHCWGTSGGIAGGSPYTLVGGALVTTTPSFRGPQGLSEQVPLSPFVPEQSLRLLDGLNPTRMEKARLMSTNGFVALGGSIRAGKDGMDPPTGVKEVSEQPAKVDCCRVSPRSSAC
ncbi:UNVERIFIED_CONTAM: hypothetical protein Sindi_1775000 [Sesamum indicum]